MDIGIIFPIPGDKVTILGTNFHQLTDSDGSLNFAGGDYPLGQTSLVFSKEGYINHKCPVLLKEVKKID